MLALTERSKRQHMTISLKKLKARLLADPEVKGRYDLLSLGDVFRERYQCTRFKRKKIIEPR
jgi:hypothetical protein